MTIERVDGIDGPEIQWRYSNAFEGDVHSPEIEDAQDRISDVLNKFRGLVNEVDPTEDMNDFVEVVSDGVDIALHTILHYERVKGRLDAHNITHTTVVIERAFAISSNMAAFAKAHNKPFDLKVIGYSLLAAAFHDSIYEFTVSPKEIESIPDCPEFTVRTPKYGTSEENAATHAKDSLKKRKSMPHAKRIEEVEKDLVADAIKHTKPNFGENGVYSQDITNAGLVAAILSAADIGAFGLNTDDYLSEGDNLLTELYPQLANETKIYSQIPGTQELLNNVIDFVLRWYKRQVDNIDPVFRKLKEQLEGAGIEEWQVEAILKEFTYANVQNSKKRAEGRYEQIKEKADYAKKVSARSTKASFVQWALHDRLDQ